MPFWNVHFLSPREENMQITLRQYLTMVLIGTLQVVLYCSVGVCKANEVNSTQKESSKADSKINLTSSDQLYWVIRKSDLICSSKKKLPCEIGDLLIRISETKDSVKFAKIRGVLVIGIGHIAAKNIVSFQDFEKHFLKKQEAPDNALGNFIASQKLYYKIMLNKNIFQFDAHEVQELHKRLRSSIEKKYALDLVYSYLADIQTIEFKLKSALANSKTACQHNKKKDPAMYLMAAHRCVLAKQYKEGRAFYTTAEQLFRDPKIVIINKQSLKILSDSTRKSLIDYEQVVAPCENGVVHGKNSIRNDEHKKD